MQPSLHSSKAFAFMDLQRWVKEGDFQPASYPIKHTKVAQHCSTNSPLYLFNGALNNLPLSHTPEFINALPPFTTVPSFSQRAPTRVCLSTIGCVWSPFPSYPPSCQYLSEHRMWDKSISYSFWSRCLLSMQKCSNSSRAAVKSSDLARQRRWAWVNTLTEVKKVPLECVFAAPVIELNICQKHYASK